MSTQDTATGNGTETAMRAAIIGTGRAADTFDEEIPHYPDADLPEGIVHGGAYTVKPKALAGGFEQVDGYELIAGANRGEQRLRDFGRRHDLQALYTDYREMLDSVDPDVVAVCTQSAQKAEAVRACADAGVGAVIVEKAFATSMAEADAMLEACDAAGTVVAVNHPFRFSPLFRRLREIAHDGSIGEFAHLTTHTGSLVHGGTHDFDIARFLGGEVASVSARVPDLDPAADDPLTGTYDDAGGDATLTFENGATAHIDGITGAHNGVVVRGTEGYVTAPRGLSGLMNLVQGSSVSAAEFGFEDSDDYGDIHDIRLEESVPAWPDSDAADRHSSTEILLTELRETLLDGEPFVSTGADGAAALELAIACYHSEIRGEPVELPLAERDLRVMNR